MEKQQPKWEGKARAKVKQVRAEQVWPLLEDFCSFDKWLPSIDTCHRVEGVNGQPGLVRYCASSSSSSSSDEEITWCHEKLISIDPVVRCLSYEILNNNLGFKSYVSTIKVLPSLLSSSSAAVARDTDDGELEMGCEIEWSFLSDPVDGMTCEALSSYIHNSLQGVAQNIEKAFAVNNT